MVRGWSPGLARHTDGRVVAGRVAAERDEGHALPNVLGLGGGSHDDAVAQEVAVRVALLVGNVEDLDVAHVGNGVEAEVGGRVGSWKQRKNYGNPPTSKQIWELFKSQDFKCKKCGGSYRLAVDHIDDNAFNGEIGNFQALCQSCNRSKRKGGVRNQDKAITVFKELKRLHESGVQVTPAQLFKRCGIPSGGSAQAKAMFLIHRLSQLHDNVTVNVNA